jgi:hypothetical protein
MSWTPTELVSVFRDLTGRKSYNQISGTDILSKINQYYQHVFPLEAGFAIPELKTWLTFDTVASTGEYDIATAGDVTFPITFPLPTFISYDTLCIQPPFYINNVQATFYTDSEKFYSEYPLDYDTEGVPVDVLRRGNSLVLRPIPDDAYECRVIREVLPEALSPSDEYPVNPIFAPMIVYGSAIMFLSSKGEQDDAEEHVPMYKHYVGLVQAYVIKNKPIGSRSRGGRF